MNRYDKSLSVRFFENFCDWKKTALLKPMNDGGNTAWKNEDTLCRKSSLANMPVSVPEIIFDFCWKQFRKTSCISPIFERAVIGLSCFFYLACRAFCMFFGKFIIIVVEGQMVFRETHSVTEMWRFLYVIFQQSVQRTSVQTAGAFCIACWGQ